MVCGGERSVCDRPSGDMDIIEGWGRDVIVAVVVGWSVSGYYHSAKGQIVVDLNISQVNDDDDAVKRYSFDHLSRANAFSRTLI